MVATNGTFGPFSTPRQVKKAREKIAKARQRLIKYLSKIFDRRTYMQKTNEKYAWILSHMTMEIHADGDGDESMEIHD